jgi:phosphoenolpyruvate-protein kinase (PTS system EI component)
MMLPMITGKAEISYAKQLVEQVKAELADSGERFDSDMKIGVMIETPAAIIDARILAKEADFFSIGTNDLAQYLFAADRSNARVAALNSHFQPALLRAVYLAVTAAHEAGKGVGICGQAAEADSLIPLWIAMGVDELSVSIPRITAVRRKICNTRKSECVGLLDEVLRLETAEEAEHALRTFSNAPLG